MHHVAQVLAPGCVPLFLTDGSRSTLTALLTHFGHWVQPPSAPGQRPHAQAALDAAARAALCAGGQVLCGVGASSGSSTAWCSARQRAIEQVLAACGWQINTSFVERLNLSLRQRVAAIGRRVNTLCQGEAGLRQQLALFQVYHNFVLPHASLRQPLLSPEVHQRHGLGQVVATVYAGDGGGLDRSRLDAARGAAVPGAAVAAAADGLKQGAG